MYSNFVFYTETYGGKDIADEKDFIRLAGKASKFIDFQTFGRLKNTTLTEEQLCEVRLCECALCDSILSEERSSGILSENNDGYSVTYDKDTHGAVNNVHNRGIVALYLWDTGLLYRGTRR